MPPVLFADATMWIKLGFLLVPVLALLWRALIGDQDEQAREERRRADMMDRMLGQPQPQSQPAGGAGMYPVAPRPAASAQASDTPSWLRSTRQPERTEDRSRERTERATNAPPVQAKSGRVQDEVEQRFEKRHVGHLSSADGPESTTAAPPEQPISSGAAAIDVSTERMRQAFLLREILRRPEW